MSSQAIYNKSYLLECLAHNDGKLFWKQRPRHHFSDDSKWSMFNTKYAGREVGNVSKRGYLRFNLSGKDYSCHRVVFLFEYGYLPKYIDHIDGNRLNNNPKNLREATSVENNRNRKVYKGSSKYKGVSWSVDKQKWRVYCSDPSLGYSPNGRSKQQYVGQSSDEISAALLYDKHAEKVYGEFAWLNRDNFDEVMVEYEKRN